MSRFATPLLALALLAGCPQTPGLLQANDAGQSAAPPLSSFADGGTTVDGSVVASGDANAIAPCDVPFQAEAYRAEIFRLVNEARAAEGLNEVSQNDTLEAQAERYACELIRYDFFDHVNPVTGSTLGDRTRDYGYAYQVVGENLAAGQRSPQEAFDDWMASPGHRQNILDPRFTELGVGIHSGGRYGLYWVQEFGRPAASAAALEPSKN